MFRFRQGFKSSWVSPGRGFEVMGMGLKFEVQGLGYGILEFRVLGVGFGV